MGTIDTEFILPEVKDQSKWWNGKHQYLDFHRQYFFSFEGTIRAGDIAYNTKLVDPREIKSYWDLLKPKWKKKIVIPDPRNPRTGGIGGCFSTISQTLAPNTLDGYSAKWILPSLGVTPRPWIGLR